jgi:hypothetical protein
MYRHHLSFPESQKAAVCILLHQRALANSPFSSPASFGVGSVVFYLTLIYLLIDLYMRVKWNY